MTIKGCFIGAALGLLSSAPLAGQETPLQEGQRIRVTVPTMGLSRASGTLVRLGNDSLELRTRERAIVIPRDQITRLDVRRQGLWGGLGLGGGVDPTMTHTDGFLLGVAGYLRLGTTVNDHLLVGPELSGWASSSEGRSWFRSNGTLTILFYPSSRGNTFLKAGAGLGIRRANHRDGSGDTSVGLGAGVGLGHDVRLGGNVFLTPSLELFFQGISIPTGTTPPSTSFENMAIVMLTVGITWQ